MTFIENNVCKSIKLHACNGNKTLLHEKFIDIEFERRYFTIYRRLYNDFFSWMKFLTDDVEKHSLAKTCHKQKRHG
jgi:hypothetical protein